MTNATRLDSDHRATAAWLVQLEPVDGIVDGRPVVDGNVGVPPLRRSGAAPLVDEWEEAHEARSATQIAADRPPYSFFGTTER